MVFGSYDLHSDFLMLICSISHISRGPASGECLGMVGGFNGFIDAVITRF